jgi:hypothetical protein
MLSAHAEELIEQMNHAQNRILIILTAAFLTGFAMGLVAAWLMMK